jgi:hypothetical protein
MAPFQAPHSSSFRLLLLLARTTPDLILAAHGTRQAKHQ